MNKEVKGINQWWNDLNQIDTVHVFNVMIEFYIFIFPSTLNSMIFFMSHDDDDDGILFINKFLFNET